MDLHDDDGFRGLNAELLSISPDSVEDWAEQVRELGIETPALSDAANKVATAYGVMQWAMPGGEPGHTFVLVDKEGTIRWIRDYGAPEHGGAMYVLPDELVPEIEKRLDSATKVGLYLSADANFSGSALKRSWQPVEQK